MQFCLKTTKFPTMKVVLNTSNTRESPIFPQPLQQSKVFYILNSVHWIGEKCYLRVVLLRIFLIMGIIVEYSLKIVKCLFCIDFCEFFHVLPSLPPVSFCCCCFLPSTIIFKIFLQITYTGPLSVMYMTNIFFPICQLS